MPERFNRRRFPRGGAAMGALPIVLPLLVLLVLLIAGVLSF